MIALNNLRRILPDVDYREEGSFYEVEAGDVYVASVLLMDEVWDQVAGKVDGDLVAVAPARDVLLFTGSESPEGLQAIRSRARDIVTSGHHVISDTLLRRVEGRWVNFD